MNGIDSSKFFFFISIAFIPNLIIICDAKWYIDFCLKMLSWKTFFTLCCIL